MNPYFFIFESGAIIGLISILCRERKNRQMVEIVSLAFFYGMILEALNIYMSKEIYVYSSAFFLEIAGVPIAIGAGWAVVYYLASYIARQFDLSWWQSPFLISLIALLYDLSMDAVAIRLGFWSWRIPLDQEWFGVPYDNFFGWLAVVWTFSLSINLSFQNFVKSGFQKAIRYLAPITSSLLLGMQIMIYVNLSAVLSGRFNWGEAMEFYVNQKYFYAYVPEVQAAKGCLLLAIIITLSFFLHKAVVSKGKTSVKTDGFALCLSSVIHLMFMFFLLVSRIYQDLPVLILVSLFVFVFTFALEMPRTELEERFLTDIF